MARSERKRIMPPDQGVQDAIQEQRAGIERNKELEQRAQRVSADLRKITRENGLMEIFGRILKSA